VSNGGINRTEGRKPYCDGNSIRGLTAPKARRKGWHDTGLMSTRDRLSIEIIVNHK
jgi:hypothetical protein